MPTAFVLAGGASLGAIEAGMIEALYERGIRPDMLVGTSAGGLNAAFLAARPPQPATAHELQERWRTVRRGDVFPLRPRTLIGGLLGIRSHLVPPDGLRRLIRQWIGVERIEATAIDLAIVVCDLLTGEEKLVTSGPAEDVLAATAAIPGVLPPVVIDGRPCVDGGVADNTPLSQALELGADRVYVLPTGVDTRLDRPPRGALALGIHSAMLLLHARLRDEIESLRDQAEIVVLPPPWPLTVSPADFRHAGALIDEARELARRHLEQPHPEGAPTDEAIRRLTAD